jgi:hypothetical protein
MSDTTELRDRIAALFRQPPRHERLGDQTPGEIADAVLAVLPAAAHDVSAALKEDCQRFRGMVLAEVWERLRDVDGGPMIDAMRVVTDMQEGR